MEINESSLAVFYVSRIFGYAPYRIERTLSGKLRRISSSIELKFYSIGLLTILVVLCTIGLYRDVEAKVPLRMKSITSKVATVFDVNVVVASCLFGVISGNFGFRQMQDVNRRLTEADDILLIYIGQENQSKGRGIKLLFPTYTAILSILALDVYGWYKQALKLMRTNPLSVNVVNNLYWYIPFYTLYVFLMTLQIQFAYVSWGLGTRYRRLNFALNTTFLKGKLFLHQKDVGFGRGSTVDYRKKVTVTNTGLRRDRAVYLHNIYLKNFAYVHESLGKAVISISSLLQDPFHTSLQIVWLVFHTFRLLLIIEPSNMTAVELESFWQQLIAKETYFTAYGICKIDRSILTTVIWSITTYLVILLQFEKIYG